MREQPDLQNTRITDWVLDHYGLRIVEVEFLPTGYQNTAAYRVVAEDDRSYFLKLRRDILEETSITVPIFLRDLGIRQIITPIVTLSRQYWTYLNDYNVLLYPFVEGTNAFKIPLTEHQWLDLGSAFKVIHSTSLPAELSNQVKRETYSREWSDKVKALLERAQKDRFDDPVAKQMARYMRDNAGKFLHLVRQAERLSSVLQAQPPPFVLCHSDIHAGNILCSPGAEIYIVDWDNPILAPKERDLMFIGGGVGGIWNTSQEEAFFYRGYRKAEINPVALDYYRFERILQDIAPNGEQVLQTNVGDKDRMRTLQGIVDFFLPGGVVEMAYKAEKTLPKELQSD